MNPVQPIEFRKVRQTTEIVNATFAFIKQNFKKLLKTLVFIAGPVVLLASLLNGLYQMRIFSGLNSLKTNSVFGGNYFLDQVLSPEYWLFIVSFMIAHVLLITIVYHYIGLYQDKGLENFDTDEVWQGVKKDIFRMLGSTLSIIIIVVIGFALLFIPGIYLAVAVTPIFMIMIRERLPFSQAFSKALKLTKGNWWRTFGVLFLLLLIQGAMGWVFQLPQTIYILVKTLHITETGQASNDLFIMIFSFLSTAGPFFLNAIVYIGIAFLYYTLTEEREGTALLSKINQIGSSPDQSKENIYEGDY